MYALKYHPSLTPQTWKRFNPGQQILMIANELKRLIKGIDSSNQLEQQACKDRVLELTDLTKSSSTGSLQKELGRWREMFSSQYFTQESTSLLQALGRSLLQLQSSTFPLIHDFDPTPNAHSTTD